MDRFRGDALCAVFGIAFGFLEPSTFLSMPTIHSITADQSDVTVVAVAVTLSFSTANYDLSVGALAGLSGIIAVVLQTSWHWSIPLSVLASVVVALVVGLANLFVVV